MEEDEVETSTDGSAVVAWVLVTEVGPTAAVSVVVLSPGEPKPGNPNCRVRR